MKTSINIRQDEFTPGHVCMIFDQGRGTFVASLEWERALQFAAAVIRVARQVEEVAKAQQVIKDGALLIRAGVPFDISNNPLILREARKEAENMGGVPGVPRTTLVGTPSLTQAPRHD